MSASLSAIQHSYTRHFPIAVPTKMAQSFVVTSTLAVLSGYAVNAALVGGVIAATATVVEAVTRPILLNIFPDNPGIGNLISIFICKVTAYNLADQALNWIGVSYKIQVTLLHFIAWASLNERTFSRNTGMAEVC